MPETTASEAKLIVAWLQESWRRAFLARDANALAALYTKDALFFGSTPDLYLGRDGVRDYFATLRADVVLDAFDTQQVVQASEDTIIAAGYWQFLFGGEARPYRLTWTIVRRDGQWLIAAHHASPR